MRNIIHSLQALQEKKRSVISKPEEFEKREKWQYSQGSDAVFICRWLKKLRVVFVCRTATFQLSTFSTGMACMMLFTNQNTERSSQYQAHFLMEDWFLLAAPCCCLISLEVLHVRFTFNTSFGACCYWASVPSFIYNFKSYLYIFVSKHRLYFFSWKYKANTFFH